MKKKLKMIKRIIAVSMAALMINIAVLSPVIEVRASDESQVPAEATSALYPLVQALLEILGIVNGLGVSYEGMNGTRSDMVQNMIDKWNAGESLQMGDQTVPDLRDVNNMADFIYNLTVVYKNHIDGTAVIDTLLQMDAKSFAATGTLYTETMYIALNEALEILSEETNSIFWNLLLNDSVGNSDTEFDFKATSMLFDALLAGEAAYATLADDAWLAPISVSEWNPTDLSRMSFDYNGITYPIFKTSTVHYVASNSDSVKYYHDFGGSVYVLMFQTSETNLNYIACSPNSFKVQAYVCTSGNQYDPINTWNSSSYGGYFYYRKSLMCRHGYSLPTAAYSDDLRNAFIDAVISDFSSFNYTTLADGVGADVRDAFSGYGTRRVKVSDASDLADSLVDGSALTAGTVAGVQNIVDIINGVASALPDAGVDVGTGEYSGILGRIFEIMKNLAASIYGFFATPLSNIKDLISAIPASIATVFEDILTIPQTLIDDIAIPLEDIKVSTQAIADSIAGVDTAEPNNGHSNDYMNIFSILIILIMILVRLLMIFFHCMQFIIAIFGIPAGTAFLPEEMVMGLNYTKSLTIPGIGMSVYSFMIGLVYICIMFYAIRTLRINIDRIKMPGRK